MTRARWPTDPPEAHAGAVRPDGGGPGRVEEPLVSAETRRRSGDGGSFVDGATGPLPLFASLAAAAGVVALGGPIGWAVVAGLGTLGASMVPGLSRAEKVRSERERQERGSPRSAARGRSAGACTGGSSSAAPPTVHERFERAVERCHAGPLRDRLGDMRSEVERARDRGHDLVDLGIDLEGAVADSRQGRPARQGRKGARKDERSPATRRLEGQRDEVERRAQDIDTSLSTAVAVAFELTLDSIHAPDDRAVDGLVSELESLRDASRSSAASPTRPDGGAGRLRPDRGRRPSPAHRPGGRRRGSTRRR